MSTLGALTLALGGLLFVTFWAMVAPIGSFVGATAALHPLWGPSQIIHCLAAIAGLLGTAGVHAEHARKTGRWGLLGSAVALIGQACFFADGVIAYAVFPPVAKAIPAALDIDGFMFSGANYSAYTAFAILFMIGYIVLGASLLYFRALPQAPVPYVAEASAGALILGGILSHLPPTAGFGVICAGGIMWGAGACILGVLWARAAKGTAQSEGAAQREDAA